MWVSVNGKLRVLGARDESSILSTRTKNFDFFEKFLYNIYRKYRNIAQLVEQRADNAEVGGPSPPIPTNIGK